MPTKLYTIGDGVTDKQYIDIKTHEKYFTELSVAKEALRLLVNQWKTRNIDAPLPAFIVNEYDVTFRSVH